MLQFAVFTPKEIERINSSLDQDQQNELMSLVTHQQAHLYYEKIFYLVALSHGLGDPEAAKELYKSFMNDVNPKSIGVRQFLDDLSTWL